MRFIEFILSVLVSLCATGMFVAAVINPSPIKAMAIVFTIVLCALSYAGTRAVFKELRNR